MTISDPQSRHPAWPEPIFWVSAEALYCFVFLALSAADRAPSPENLPMKSRTIAIILIEGGADMTIIKIILEIALFFLALTLGLMFLPVIIGIFIGIMKFEAGKILGGIIAIVIGIICQIIFFAIIYGAPDLGYAGEDEECPNCGSSATDGNHCYDCGDDF